jgi:hypothetical protein
MAMNAPRFSGLIFACSLMTSTAAVLSQNASQDEGKCAAFPNGLLFARCIRGIFGRACSVEVWQHEAGVIRQGMRHNHPDP